MSKKDFDFRDCPCCGGKRLARVQDKVHLDWQRECFDCGYSQELMPRSITRNSSSKFNATPVADFFESTKEGFRFAMNLEDLETPLTDL